MATVTQIVNQIKQPRGGYLSIKKFSTEKFSDGNILYEDENIAPTLIGITTDYLVRFILTNNKKEAFSISLQGAINVNEEDIALKLLENINSLDDLSITCACKLAGYDVCYRMGPIYYKDISGIVPNKNTINNIRILVKRTLSYFKGENEIIQSNITFDGAYTYKIHNADADYLTNNGLYDLKVSKNVPSTKNTLQLLIYYIMGLHSSNKSFMYIEKIGIFNPRLNVAYTIMTNKIDKSLIKMIEKEIIGYNEVRQEMSFKTSEENLKLSIIDLMKILKCSRHQIINYYVYEDLPLRKDERDHYYIYEKDFRNWINEINNKQEIMRQRSIFMTLLGIILILIFIIIFLILI